MNRGIMRVTYTIAMMLDINAILPDEHRIIAIRHYPDEQCFDLVVEGTSMPINPVDAEGWPRVEMFMRGEYDKGGAVIAAYGRWRHQLDVEWPIPVAACRRPSFESMIALFGAAAENA